MSAIACPRCRHMLRFSSQEAGKRGKCCRCACMFQLPAQRQAQEPPENSDRRRPPQIPFASIQLVLPLCLSIGAWVGLMGLLVVLVCLIEATGFHVSDAVGFGLVLDVPILVPIVPRIWFLMEMHRAWKHMIYWLKRDRMDPPIGTADQAIGLLFVPFVNLWWMQHFFGIGKWLTAVVQSSGVNIGHAAEDLGAHLFGWVLLGNIALALNLVFPPCVFVCPVAGIMFEVTLIVLAKNLQRTFNQAGPFLGGAF